jgi:ABC-type Fe3+-hydroxamate transport system substrate-binding protein
LVIFDEINCYSQWVNTVATQQVVDALNRSIEIPLTPQRIVSLVPSLTEWLFAIGLGERVCGVTDFCLRPADAVATKIKLRGTKNPDRARIIALQPDVVIANKEENRQRDVEALTAAGIPVYITDPRTVQDAIAELATLARVLGAEVAAQPLIAEMQTQYASILTRAVKTRMRVLALIWRDPWMAIGDDTFANDLLHCCGVHNAGRELGGRYPRFPLDVLPSLRLDRILLLSEPYAFGVTDLPDLRAWYAGQINFVDGELLTWYGPRLTLALKTFSDMFAE